MLNNRKCITKISTQYFNTACMWGQFEVNRYGDQKQAQLIRVQTLFGYVR